jgi:MFS family permease
VQPTVGAISDYTVSRWGRRKPYIAIGAVLDVVFLVGIALSNDYVAVVAFVALLQFSSNFAQGPFQGYVPDLVPAQQVGLASGLMGLMIIFGRIVGVAIAAVGLVTRDFVPSTIGLGLFELATAIATLVTVHEGRGAPSRGGRSLWRIGLAAWGLDILKERSYVWFLASRLFILMATVTLSDLMLFYLRRSLRLTDGESAFWVTVAIAILAVMTGLTTYPAARLSDRIGRKKTIYFSCLVGSVALVGMVLAPHVLVAICFAVPMGVAAGIFLAVDWALMTDIIPKATSGRYMGISNVVTGGAGPLAVTLGGVTIDLLDRFAFGAGPRAAFALGIGFYALGALLLRPVDERRREK